MFNTRRCRSLTETTAANLLRRASGVSVPTCRVRRPRISMKCVASLLSSSRDGVWRPHWLAVSRRLCATVTWTIERTIVQRACVAMHTSVVRTSRAASSSAGHWDVHISRLLSLARDGLPCELRFSSSSRTGQRDLTAELRAGVTAGTLMTGAEQVVSALEQLGVDVVFGLPGVHNLAIWEAFGASSIRLIGVRHEQTAAFAADGYARATGRLGVAIVTTGPGAANTLAAVGEAFASGSAILVIATDIPTSLRIEGVYRGVLHEAIDQGAMFEPIVKRQSTASDVNHVAASVVEAGRLASEAPSRPVYLGIPIDLLTTVAHATLDSERQPPSADPRQQLDEASLNEARRLVDSAERILVWVGGGALRAGAGPVVGELATLIAAPVVTTHGARGLLPPDHPCAVMGPVQIPEVGRLWDEADLVIAIGTDFDGVMTQNWAMPAPRTLLAINIDVVDASKNYRPDLILVGDAREVVAQLISVVSRRATLPKLRRRLAKIAEAVDRRVRDEEPQAAALLDILGRVLPDDAVLIADMCVAGYWIGGFHRIPAPRKLVYPLGWGTLGFAFPASLGAATANVGRAICICGDGGFLFACGELATLAQEGLPVTVVIVDDGGYGMLRFDQIHMNLQPRGVDLSTPNFVDLARSFGIRAEQVDGFGETFADRLAEFIDSSAPNVLVVRAALYPPPTVSMRWYRR
jgi:thiamine pyrophosphate-dependent acetolactate synthase large subunit-like protein